MVDAAAIQATFVAYNVLRGVENAIPDVNAADRCFLKGQQVLEGGKVLGAQLVSGDSVVLRCSGTEAGSLYNVRISIPPSAFSCTCPAWHKDAICKHVVACLLWLQVNLVPPPAGAAPVALPTSAAGQTPALLPAAQVPKAAAPKRVLPSSLARKQAAAGAPPGATDASQAASAQRRPAVPSTHAQQRESGGGSATSLGSPRPPPTKRRAALSLEAQPQPKRKPPLALTPSPHTQGPHCASSATTPSTSPAAAATPSRPSAASSIPAVTPSTSSDTACLAAALRALSDDRLVQQCRLVLQQAGHHSTRQPDSSGSAGFRFAGGVGHASGTAVAGGRKVGTPAAPSSPLLAGREAGWVATSAGQTGTQLQRQQWPSVLRDIGAPAPGARTATAPARTVGCEGDQRQQQQQQQQQQGQAQGHSGGRPASGASSSQKQAQQEQQGQERQQQQHQGRSSGQSSSGVGSGQKPASNALMRIKLLLLEDDEGDG